ACEADNQGRILIPAKLRESAALDKDVVFVGVLNKIEIWSKERWENNNDYDDVDAIAEHMSEYGISF
ncbi:MAG TPA: division/cell wall cluster transcriptional repressor MraZ, partial [Mobilitalea sp.]|nr:division/cell wall cluster transcriptional repressor MraZ [Mobilitalea sp.]